MMYKVGYQISSFIDEIVTENFEDPLHLMEYLNSNGLSSCGKNDRQTVLRDVILGVSGVYNSLYSVPFDTTSMDIEEDYGEVENMIPASFHILQFIGWKYHKDQIQPKERGSGSSIEQFVDEILEGDEEAKKRVRFGTLEEEDLSNQGEGYFGNYKK